MSLLIQRYNGDNARVHFSIDTVHYGKMLTYCGREVGQSGYDHPCPKCDGRCGPDNGCQCESCLMLDQETKRRSCLLGIVNAPVDDADQIIDHDVAFFNMNGHRCHVSYNTVLHDPQAQGQHSSSTEESDQSMKPIAGYRFYCGRSVQEEGGYHNNCQLCDGRCGPDNGCQCLSCYLLDCLLQTIDSAEDECLNRLDARVQVSYDWLHSKTYKRYCGQNVGCQGYHRDSDSVGDNVCLDCTGFCGPRFGCQCEACFELEHVIDLRHRVLLLHDDDAVTADAANDADVSTSAIKSDYQRKLPLRNDDDAIVHVSYNVLDETCHPLVSEDGYRFYCGRDVSSCGGYYNDCTYCDGVCGPGDGCQCFACFVLEQKYIALSRTSPKVTNSVSTTSSMIRLRKNLGGDDVVEEIQALSTTNDCFEMEIRMQEWMKMLLTKKVSNTLLQCLSETCRNQCYFQYLGTIKETRRTC
jgi:hypothetical protein